MQVDEEICQAAEERPSSVTECGPAECEAGGWSSGAWSACSVSCGYGVETRPVSCRPAGSRCEGERPLTSRHCRGPCTSSSGQHGAGWVRLEDGATRDDPPDDSVDDEEDEKKKEEKERKLNVTDRGRAEYLETSGQLSLSPSGKSLMMTLCAVVRQLWSLWSAC